MLRPECWLTPSERDEVIRALLHHGLIKLDNRRALPLASGGTTDIYVNLRNARSNPKATAFLANLYANALRRRPDFDRFVEIPEAISNIAGVLSTIIGKPQLTIRKVPKDGRATGGKTIGDYRFGENVIILDDVITDGESKLVPWKECLALGLNPKSFIVLVDRQQGWRTQFQKLGITAPVWPGMTLHDIRQFVIENGFMERCHPETEKKNPIIVALDNKTWDEILPTADALRTTGCIFKVNDLAVFEGAGQLIPALNVYGRVMLDLKFHDIPNTVANACNRVKPFKPWAVTVHASGHTDMIKAAVDTFKDSGTLVFGVTVLTSWDKATCQEVYQRLPIDQVKLLAKIAFEAGAQGLVCSPEEVAELKAMYPDKIFITPGIRSPLVAAHDQKRVATPAEAWNRGANYLVMGRQLLAEVPDPVTEVKRVLTEELNIT